MMIKKQLHFRATAFSVLNLFYIESKRSEIPGHLTVCGFEGEHKADVHYRRARKAKAEVVILVRYLV
jgi:hypothetical protein